MKIKGNATQIVGIVMLGKESADMAKIEKKTDVAELATHVLQLVFLSHTGRFRFPFAHYPTGSISSSSLFLILWDAFSWLLRAGFRADACVADGGENNRGLFKLHFPENDINIKSFTIKRSLFSPHPFTFVMDPKVISHFNYSSGIFKSMHTV